MPGRRAQGSPRRGKALGPVQALGAALPCRGLSLLRRVPLLEEQGLLRSLPALSLGAVVLASALRKA